MKKTLAKPSLPKAKEMRAEYRFDYQKARPNCFAGQTAPQRVVVLLDPDIAQVFTTPESVNTVLRALIATMPRPRPRRVRKSQDGPPVKVPV